MKTITIDTIKEWNKTYLKACEDMKICLEDLSFQGVCAYKVYEEGGNVVFKRLDVAPWMWRDLNTANLPRQVEKNSVSTAL